MDAAAIQRPEECDKSSKYSTCIINSLGKNYKYMSKRRGKGYTHPTLVIGRSM